MFHICIPWGKTLSLVPKVKVVCQDQIQISRSHFSKKIAVAGTLVFHKHILLILLLDNKVFNFSNLTEFFRRQWQCCSNCDLVARFIKTHDCSVKGEKVIAIIMGHEYGYYQKSSRAGTGRNFVPGYPWPYYQWVLRYLMLLRPIKLKINSCLSLFILALAHVLVHLNGQI